MSTNKRPRDYESDEVSGEEISVTMLNDQFSFEMMKPLHDVLLYRDRFEISYVDRVVAELKRFLILKVITNDLDASQLSPSLKVDHAWHTLLQLPQVSYLCIYDSFYNLFLY